MVLSRRSVRSSFLALAVIALNAANLIAQNPVPFVNQPLSPSSATPGSPGFVLTVNGAQFVLASVVNWNGTPLSTTFVNADKLTAVVPASLLAAAGTASVTVSSPTPGGGRSNADLFTVTKPSSSFGFTSSTLSGGQDFVVADFNNDGKLDVAEVGSDPSCDGTAGTIFIFLGNGNGTFNKSTLCVAVNIPTAELFGPIVARDFDGDGKTDLVVTSQIFGDTYLTALLGNGDGTFGSPIVSGLNWGSSVAGDFNRDGKLDLAIVGEFEGEFSAFGVMFGGGDGTFSGGPQVDNVDVNLAAGDYNGDGILDAAIVSGGSVEVLLGDGAGGFNPLPPQNAPLVEPAFVTSADFDGDGILDLAIADVGSNALTVLKGNGDGTFTAINGEPSLPQPANFVTTADLNGDGKLDLVFLNAACYTCSGNAISIYLGNGDGTFQPGYSQLVDSGTRLVDVQDFNGDGRPDIALGNSILLQTPPRSGTKLSLVADNNPSYLNQPTTFTAVLLYGKASPSGSVIFRQGVNILGTAPLIAGQANLTIIFAKAGTFPVVAIYSDSQAAGSKYSQTVKQIVNKYESAISLTSDQNPSVYGQPVNLECIVDRYQYGDTVTFKNATSVLGTISLTDPANTASLAHSNGCVFSIMPAHAGPLSITATYNGDALINPSTATPVSQVVSPASTTTTLTASPNPSRFGKSVKLEATVSSPTVVPTGTVTFTAGTANLGTAYLSGGKASITRSTLPQGTTTVTATYNGTANITGSSGSVQQTVN